jgi:hypothetical protein
MDARYAKVFRRDEDFVPELHVAHDLGHHPPIGDDVRPALDWPRERGLEVQGLVAEQLAG